MCCTGEAGCAGHEAAPDVDLLLTHDGVLCGTMA
jgi:hypothetical protein